VFFANAGNEVGQNVGEGEEGVKRVRIVVMRKGGGRL
jgi:hypothetical protein